jgi:hypothetical protein
VKLLWGRLPCPKPPLAEPAVVVVVFETASSSRPRPLKSPKIPSGPKHPEMSWTCSTTSG